MDLLYQRGKSPVDSKGDDSMHTTFSVDGMAVTSRRMPTASRRMPTAMVFSDLLGFQVDENQDKLGWVVEKDG